jgi:hypothetical protein
LSKDYNEEDRDIIKASGGNGYAVLHKDMRNHHPRLTEKKVETKIPSQGITTRFGHHVRAIQEHLFREDTRGRMYTKYEALQLVLDTLHPVYHLELKFRSEKEFGQGHDYEDSIPFNLQMPQLGTTLSSWATEMSLGENRTTRVLCIGQDHSEDDDSLETPAIHALANDLNCKLCGRPGHEDTTCHRFMNHVIGDALMKTHPKETARILREHKQFVTIGPRGTPRHDERTDRRPASDIRVISKAETTDKECTDEVDCEVTPVHCATMDKTIQIKYVKADDTSSFGSSESEGMLDYDPITRIAACRDVSMGVRYDEALVDRINANWDEELLSSYNPDAHLKDTPPTEILYEDGIQDDAVEFYDALESQGKDMPTTERS